MIVYLETSVLLRRLFKEKPLFKDWGNWNAVCTSQLTRVESFRALDRLRLQGKMSDLERTNCIQELNEALDQSDEIALTSLVLKRAAQAHPTVVGTLDALHLASAYLWQEQTKKELLFLTHDVQLGRAALALGMKASGF